MSRPAPRPRRRATLGAVLELIPGGWVKCPEPGPCSWEGRADRLRVHLAQDHRPTSQLEGMVDLLEGRSGTRHVRALLRAAVVALSKITPG